MFDGHNGLDGRSGVALRPEYRNRDALYARDTDGLWRREKLGETGVDAGNPILRCPSNHAKAADTFDFVGVVTEDGQFETRLPISDRFIK